MIPLAEPNLTGKEKEYVTDAIASGWVSGGGPYVEKFEDMVARACGKKWAVATITGSAALHAALVVSGVDKHRTALLPSMTFIAAANALETIGATLAFVDIDKKWTPDVSLVSTVWDCAPAVGQKLPPGLCCLSFNGNKTITTGQGGAVVGDDWLEFIRTRAIVNNCKVEEYSYADIGYNYRMANINAAMGCAQMDRLEEFLERKSAIIQRYKDAGLKIISSKWMALWCTNSYRNKKIAGLYGAGIDARGFWKPIHLQQEYIGLFHGPLPRTESIWKKLICLPCSTNLTEADQDKVIAAIHSLG